jgi:hypothetical protein
VFGTTISTATLALEERQLRRTPRATDLGRLALAAMIENFGYRQANLIFRLRGIWTFLRKDTAWASVPRTGFTRVGDGARTRGSMPRDRRVADQEHDANEPERKAAGQ